MGSEYANTAAWSAPWSSMSRAQAPASRGSSRARLSASGGKRFIDAVVRLSPGLNPLDIRVGEDVAAVVVVRGELGDHGALGASLEPVQRVGRDGVLLAGAQGHLVPDAVVGAAMRGRRLAGHIQVHQAPAAAEGLLFAGAGGRRGRVAVLRAGLAGEQH